ncbi:MAG: ABC transporter permease [Anaerolineales bacterium]|jgi:ABC-2 type transport system permease protein
MRKLIISAYKEALLLLRDIEGIVLLNIMPIVLVIVISLIQERSFQNILESKINVVIVDFDNDSLGAAFRRGIDKSNVFETTEIISGDSILLENARYDVARGKYQIGIFIPANTTQRIKMRAINLVQKQLPFSVSVQPDLIDSASIIRLFFDPITKPSFKNLAKSRLIEFAAQTETRIIFETYARVINAITNQSGLPDFPSEPIIRFEEDLVSEYTAGIIPNSVQHNVPAWTLFGMFLICIPIAGNIIKERNEGCLAKLKTMPITYFNIMSGKIIIFIFISLLQAAFIFLIGIYFLPFLGLPQLQIHHNWIALFTITLASAFAATGFGIVIGTLSSTIVQASTFGSVSTVILAAIGGIWIPVSLMPEILRKISEISPMNWGIHGFYDVFLRNATVFEIWPYVIKLIGFYGVCIIISILFRKYQVNR